MFLLNACLTVRPHAAASHSKKGWEEFTDAAIRVLSARRSGLVFLLWGRFAQQKRALVDSRKHHILTAAHPSGFSANKVCMRAVPCHACMQPQRSQQEGGLRTVLLGNRCLCMLVCSLSSDNRNVDGALCRLQGFFGCKHFSKANALLAKEGLPPIDWQIE